MLALGAGLHRDKTDRSASSSFHDCDLSSAILGLFSSVDHIAIAESKIAPTLLRSVHTVRANVYGWRRRGRRICIQGIWITGRCNPRRLLPLLLVLESLDFGFELDV
jgi:hypothetical protein